MAIFNLSFSQCKQIINEECPSELRNVVERLNDQPKWLQSMGVIEEMCTLQSISQGGCASGAYMPAVTYHTALETMLEHGDDILSYIEDQLDRLLYDQ
jgi:hypothetical protein